MMRRLWTWLKCRMNRHEWEQRTTRRGGRYEACALCSSERIGGLVVELERRRRGGVA